MKIDLDGTEEGIFFRTYLERAIGEIVNPKAAQWNGDFALALGNQRDGEFIYELDQTGRVVADLTPKHVAEGYEPQYNGAGSGLIRTENLGAYDVAAESYTMARGRNLTTTHDGAERIFGIIKAALSAEQAIETTRQNANDYQPVFSTSDDTACATEARNRLINALAEALGL